MKILRVIVTAALIFASVLTLSAQQYRSITAFKFNYYTDDRSSLNYEEVLIIPLPDQYYLITGVSGDLSDFDSSLGGKIGIAFDLPGFYYGETSLKYEREFDNPDRNNYLALNGSVTYETGGTRASLEITGEITGEITEENKGVVFSPGLNYLIYPDWEVYAKYFSGYHRYGSEQFFNHAIWAGTNYQVLPTIWISLGGTAGTVYEPGDSYEKWSLITGVKVYPTENFSVRYQFEYESTPHYEIISNGVVADWKL